MTSIDEYICSRQNYLYLISWQVIQVIYGKNTSFLIIIFSTSQNLTHYWDSEKGVMRCHDWGNNFGLFWILLIGWGSIESIFIMCWYIMRTLIALSREYLAIFIWSVLWSFQSLGCMQDIKSTSATVKMSPSQLLIIFL